MKKQLDLLDQLEFAEKIAKLHMQGNSKYQIAQQFDELTPRDVEMLLSGWKRLLRKESETAVQIKDKVMDILIEADQHWSMIAKEAWETVEQADQQGVLGQKINALKLIETVNKNRTKAFADAGVNQDSALVDEMNETQRKQDLLIDILRETKKRYPNASEYIAKKLTELTNEVEVLEVESGG